MKESSQLGQGGPEDQAQHFLHESVPTLNTRDLPEAAAAWWAESWHDYRDKDLQGLFLSHFSEERVRNSFCVFHFSIIHSHPPPEDYGFFGGFEAFLESLLGWAANRRRANSSAGFTHFL